MDDAPADLGFASVALCGQVVIPPQRRSAVSCYRRPYLEAQEAFLGLCLTATVFLCPQ